MRLYNTIIVTDILVLGRRSQGDTEFSGGTAGLRYISRTYFCWAESLAEKSEKKTEALTSARKAYMKSIRLCNEYNILLLCKYDITFVFICLKIY